MQPVVTSFRSVQYLVIVLKWKRSIENFDIESKFLHHLFEDYFACYVSDFFSHQLRVLEERLNELDQVAIQLDNDLEDQLSIINKMVDGEVKDNTEYIEDNQIALENRMDVFSKNLSMLKGELYGFVEQNESCHERFSIPC